MNRAARIALPLYLLVIYSTLGVIRQVSNALRDANLLRVTVACMFAAAVVALVVLLWRLGRLGHARTWVTLGLAGVAYAAALWPMESPEEKVHFIEYGVVAALAFFAAPERLQGFERHAAAAVFTLAAGWVDEGIQALLPSRYYDLRDVAFNGAAGVFALFVVAGCRWSPTRTHADRHVK
ncbi:MAG: VanZ family protein [Myxococcaceae bacterium]|nr:VanZ family protein [Myxococcaceae bacterium]